MWRLTSSGAPARRDSAAIASRSAKRRVRYVSSRAETRIRATGYARSWESWSAGAIATRFASGPFSSASTTRARPIARARAYAGSDSNSSRVTCSARMKADASWRNGYFARPASSTVEGTLVQLKRPRRGYGDVEAPDDIANAPSVGRRSFRTRTIFSPDG